MDDIIKIGNDRLIIEVNRKGAQLWSVKDKQGTEYLWQGDVKYWEDRSPILFPYIARLTDGKYVYKNDVYSMDIHGFAKDMYYDVIYKEVDIIRLKMQSHDFGVYPFEFEFYVNYILQGNSLKVLLEVNNMSGKRMYFGIGGHSGFNVPVYEDTIFEDYYIDFSQDVEPIRIGMSSECFVNGEDSRFELCDGRLLLNHQLFDDDAIILKDMGKSVTLGCFKTMRHIKVEYEKMKYLGLWHRPNTDAPYICIEPWTSLPSREGVIENLELQENLVTLEKDESYSCGYSITIND